MSIDGIVALGAAIILGIVAFIFGSATRKKKKPLPLPNNDAARDVARETIQQTFEDAVDGIAADAEDPDAAELLAQRGNSRRRGTNRRGKK